jgi:hypothetical protein
MVRGKQRKRLVCKRTAEPRLSSSTPRKRSIAQNPPDGEFAIGSKGENFRGACSLFLKMTEKRGKEAA